MSSGSPALPPLQAESGAALPVAVKRRRQCAYLPLGGGESKFLGLAKPSPWNLQERGSVGGGQPPHLRFLALSLRCARPRHRNRFLSRKGVRSSPRSGQRANDLALGANERPERKRRAAK